MCALLSACAVVGASLPLDPVRGAEVGAVTREALETHMIAELSAAMRDKLAQRRHHGDWREQPMEQLAYHLGAEMRELCEALSAYQARPNSITLHALRDECADVANMAGIIWDLVNMAEVDPTPEIARWQARVKLLEARLDAVREVVG